MTRGRATPIFFARALSLVLLVMTASCGMLIGIEDLNPGGGPDAAGGGPGADAPLDRSGTGGTGGTGGGPDGTAGSSGAGSDASDVATDRNMPGADAMNDGRADAPIPDGNDDRSTIDATSDGAGPDATDASSTVDGSDGGVSTDGAPPDTANPDAGSADASVDGGAADVGSDAPPGDAGSDRPPTITVTGRIIDYWRHVVPNVPVTIGTTAATTDMNGQFVVSGVAPPYDVFFTISTIQNNTPAKYGWIYKGLTRTDPTLQVGRAFPERSASQLDINVTSIDFANLPATETVHTSFGSVDGAFDTDITGTPTHYIQSSWFGPTSTSMTGHALHWTRASSSSLDLPTGYSGYVTQGVSLVDANMTSVAFDLPNTTIDTGTLSGTISGSMSGTQLESSMFVRFADNAVIQLASVTPPSSAFSYKTPAIAQATFTIAASQGIWSSPPYAIVHKDGLASTQSGIALQVPDAPSLIAPAGGTTGVTPSTLFRWSGTAKVFLWSVSFDAEYKGFFIVTADKQAQIPTMPDGPALTPNASYLWWVETNGSYQSVDEATGTDGMMDSFRYGVLWGAVRGDGTYTSSEESSFSSAP